MRRLVLSALFALWFVPWLSAQDVGLVRPPRLAPPDSRAPASVRSVPMVRLPGGTFRMGCTKGDPVCALHELPPRRVAVRPFDLDRREVTGDDYDACVEAGACARPPDTPGCPGDYAASADMPAACVSWAEARAFCAWAGKRLPTEAEWEYAARAGADDRWFWWGKKYDWMHANNLGVGGRDQWREAAPPGSFGPDPYGFFDLIGNAAEWVEDCYHNSYLGGPKDGSAWEEEGCGRRVKRGGSWKDDATLLRVSARLGVVATDRDRSLGFRCARSIPPVPAGEKGEKGEKSETGENGENDASHR
jgi:formylglycine-generating enzyme required for sulfatase activity